MSAATIAVQQAPMATCWHCTHVFTGPPVTDAAGETVDYHLRDDHGHLCCPTCFCTTCGNGHHSDAQRDACDARFAEFDPDQDRIDPDDYHDGYRTTP